MLTKADIEFIKQTRIEITQNRTNSVEIIHLVEGAEDPFTGDPAVTETPEVVEGTWRTYTSESPGSNDISYVNGVRVESGDCMAEFDLSVDLSDVRRVKLVRSGVTFDIQAKDKIGLGEINRHYVLLRKVT